MCAKAASCVPRRGARLSPLIAEKIKATTPARIGAIAGDLARVEDMFALQSLMESLGVASLDCRQDGTKLDPKFGRASYLFNADDRGDRRGGRAS